MILEKVKKAFPQWLVEVSDDRVTLQLENRICITVENYRYGGMWRGQLFFTPNDQISQKKILVSLPNDGERWKGGRFREGKVQGVTIEELTSFVQNLSAITQRPNLAKDTQHYYYSIRNELAEFAKNELSFSIYDDLINLDGKFEVILTNNQFAIRAISYNGDTDLLTVYLCKFSKGKWLQFKEYSHVEGYQLHGMERHIQKLDLLNNKF
ncbi:hypothetical protein [Risungbinella massiliensis]|uniref:hypothetical protein n=1 Tax=Risungbinella massiliensis TaxID=1329796 RepID=UPI0005CC8B78|nr:hypothetical protein [Risungbinella massiliensis]